MGNNKCMLYITYIIKAQHSTPIAASRTSVKPSGCTPSYEKGLIQELDTNSIKPHPRHGEIQASTREFNLSINSLTHKPNPGWCRVLSCVGSCTCISTWDIMTPRMSSGHALAKTLTFCTISRAVQSIALRCLVTSCGHCFKSAPANALRQFEAWCKPSQEHCPGSSCK